MDENSLKPSRRLRTVLQIEDNSANATLVEQLLERRSDLTLLTAVTGYQGINMACMNQPDVILLDINLPDISGYSALRFLRDNPMTVHIPVIALSSDAFLLHVKAALAAGFFHYITKPYKIDALMRAIDAALESSFQQGNRRQYDRRLLGPKSPRATERRCIDERRSEMGGYQRANGA